ncbi:hypothetical protein PMKS-001335 [Pichia membranifaciens]|uniref:RRM domain-containing protein n=1 Tax=Pichia membranifaciens TaxID=4926 RepID=A0A1Q2YE77_9ASCO|nr:hypothetical protein PMKS-001335 [Pichia membranifaciens]
MSTSLYALNRSTEELSSSLNRISLNNTLPSSSSSSSTSSYTILKIKNIPRDISLREAFLIFSLCLNDVNFVDIVQEPASNAPVIFSKFYSPKIASQVHQLLNGKPLFGAAFPNVQCEIVNNGNSTITTNKSNNSTNNNASSSNNPNTASNNSYLFSNPFTTSNNHSSSPSSPTLQISKIQEPNNDMNNTLIHSLNHFSAINTSTGNITGWTNETSTPLATPSNNSKILRPDPSLSNSSKINTSIINNSSKHNNNKSNLPTPIITDWSQTANTSNNNNNYFNSTSLNMTDLTTPSSATFSIPSLPQQKMESPLDSQHLDSLNLTSNSITNGSLDDDLHKQTQLHRQQSHELSINTSIANNNNGGSNSNNNNNLDVLRHYQQPPNPGQNSNSGSNPNVIPELSLLARVPPPANPADQNPPCNTLYVGNLPLDTTEIELRTLFQSQPGFKRLSFRTKQTNGITSHHGPMCFVEFEDVALATRALAELYGKTLPRVNGTSNNKGGIRLSFSKNPLGVRGPGQQRRNNTNISTSNNNSATLSNAGANGSASGGGSLSKMVSNNNNNTNSPTGPQGSFQRNNSLPTTTGSSMNGGGINSKASSISSMNFNNPNNINGVSNMVGFSFMSQQFPYQ